MFRAIAERALINRMGFNNPGADALALRLQTMARRRPLAVTLSPWELLGKIQDHSARIKPPKTTPTSFRVLRDHADFFVVNVSSPNTPNLRTLQDRAALDEILAALQSHQPNPANHRVAAQNRS